MTKKLIIDTDPGIDDAMAIHLALAHPGLNLVGLTTVFGNVWVEQATRNALALVEMAGAKVPVAEGAAKPLVQPLHPPAHFVHGPEGFGHVPAMEPEQRPDPRPADRFLVDMINAHPGEIWLCPIAPLTNIADALRLDPGIAAKVAGVVIMGGAVDVPGNVSKHAEANIWNDPHAAAEVFAADWPITLIGLDVTEDVRCSPEDFAAIEQASPVIGGFLNRAVPFYFDFHKTKPHFRHKPFDGCFMHDPSAVLCVDDPGLFEIRETPIRVITEGDQIGQTAADPSAPGQPVKVATKPSAAVRARYIEIVSGADKAMAARMR